MKAKDILRYVLWIAVAVVLLYFSFRGVNWKDFWAALVNCNWAWVLASMLIGLLALFLRGLRWQMLLMPIDPDTRVSSCFNGINICMLVNIVLPRVGEVVRCGYVTSTRATFDKVFGTVVVDRIWDAISMLAVFVIMLSLLWHRFGSFFEEHLFSSLSAKVPALIAIAVIAVIALVLLFWLSYRLRDRGRFWGKVRKIVEGFGEGLKSCFHMEKGWLFIVYTAAIWACYWLMSATIIWAIQGIDPASIGTNTAEALEKVRQLGLADALFLMFAGALSSLIPVPGGFGAFHSVVSLALSSVYGIPFSIGLIFATLSHESQIIMDGAAGGVSYLAESLKKH